MKNPQADFEDSIFGQNGMHPTPKSLPYPTQNIETIYGETVEYLIPTGQKEKVLKKLYPFGDPPPLDATLLDIHSKKEFVVRDFKVIEQNGYVMAVSPYFAEDGASVVDWQPKDSGEDGMHVDRIVDGQVEAAFSAGRADGFTGMPKDTAKPIRGDGMSSERYSMIESAYDEGYEAGVTEREDQQGAFMPFCASRANRRSWRR